MNAKAAEILSQLQTGTVIAMVDGKGAERTDLGTFTVESFSAKSVHFTNGKYENNRSLFRYIVKSQPEATVGQLPSVVGVFSGITVTEMFEI